MLVNHGVSVDKDPGSSDQIQLTKKGEFQNSKAVAAEFYQQLGRLRQLNAGSVMPEEGFESIRQQLAELNGLASGGGKLPRFLLVVEQEINKQALKARACIGISSRTFATAEEFIDFYLLLQNDDSEEGKKNDKKERLLDKHEMDMYLRRVDLDGKSIILPTSTTEGDDFYPLVGYYEYKFPAIVNPDGMPKDIKKAYQNAVSVNHLYASENLAVFRHFTGCTYHIVTCRKDILTPL